VTFAIPVDLSHNRDDYLIFCGTARSGTTYISEVCQALGLDVQHERYGEDGIAAFQLAPFLYLFDKATIFHQVREPLACITSIQTANTKTWNNIYNHLPMLDRDDLVHRCMQYYYYWNRLIEQWIWHRHRVETLTLESWVAICTVSGHDPIKTSLPDISQTTNTRADNKLYKPLTWTMLHDIDHELCDRIQEMGRDYGYDSD
jgi:hypothetical protein